MTTDFRRICPIPPLLLVIVLQKFESLALRGRDDENKLLFQFWKMK